MPAPLSIGVAGTLGPGSIARIARMAESAGLAALWVNDTAQGDALSALAAAAATTTGIRLATGVLPVDRHRATDIAARAADLPQERLTVGVGSGAARSGQLDLVAQAVDVLHERTSAAVLVGALGPRMRRLAAERADGPLLSWLSPDRAAVQAAAAHSIRSSTHVALYVRTALDEAAVPRLREETARYASFPAYAANFARLDLDPGLTVLDPATVEDRLPAYRAAAGEVVLRAIVVRDDVAEYERFLASVATLA